MGFMDSVEKELINGDMNRSRTENGALGYRTTGKFPGELETAKEEAAKKAKAKAERSFAYEKRAIESDKKHAEEMAAAEIANLKSQVESLKQANNELTNKLDDAYKKMNEVATATVQAGATVKVVSSDK